MCSVPRSDRYGRLVTKLKNITDRSPMHACTAGPKRKRSIVISFYKIPCTYISSVRCLIIIWAFHYRSRVPDIHVVTKKDGGIRFCRRLNAVSTEDCYPMPRVDELIDRLGTAKFISTLDLSRGYWQVPMAAELRRKHTLRPVRIQRDAVWTARCTIYLPTYDG